MNNDQHEATGMTGADAVARVIATLDPAIVVGMPGGHMIRVFDALRDRQDTIRTMLLREESLATVMAEAYGRLTGKPMVVMGQGAWVLGNAGIGIMEAHLGSSPMLLLIDATEGGSYSHHGPYQSGLGDYGAYDIVAGFRAITKRTFVANDPVQAAQLTQLAIKHAMTGEPGPVAVVFHSRALINPVEAADAKRIYFNRSYNGPGQRPAAAAEVERAAALIADARRPVIVAGSGVRLSQGAGQALLDFAKTAGIPVATTSAGKGVFPESDALGLGVMGTFGRAAANAVVGSADLVLAVGTKLGATDTVEETPALIDPTRQTMLQIDIEPLNAGWTFPVDLQLVGDAAATLTALTALTGLVGTHPGDGVARVTAARQTAAVDASSATPGAQLSARRAVQVLSEELPAEAVVTCDAGENRLFMLHDFVVRPGGSFMQPTSGGGMGYAVPAAMAAAVEGSRPAVAVCGDGGFSMVLHGLMSAIENELNLTVVVLDNQALGWVLHGQGERPFASEFARFDLAGIAAAIGCHASEVSEEGELRKALQVAADHRGVSVVAVRTSLQDKFSDVVSPLARRHVESVEER
jgi:acetolactate synthase-1/2/3 large subunit